MPTEGTLSERVLTEGPPIDGLPTEGLPTEGFPTDVTLFEGSPTVLACGTAFGGPAVSRGLVVCWG